MAGTICVAYAYFIEPHRLVIRHHEQAVKDMDPAFDGFRIAMIADTHGGSHGGSVEDIERIVASVNTEDVDLIVLLGDYVSEGRDGRLKMPMPEIADALAGLQAREGVLAVLGNHDWRYGDETVARELSRVGYRVLQNDVAVVERNGRRLRFLGLVDVMHAGDWKEYSDKAKAAAAATEGQGPLIFLEHSPDILPLVTGDLNVSSDARLFLTAHTHGGQVWLPILGRPVIPSSYGQKYAYGHILDRGLDIWVTSGTGTSILPFRFMVPPEILVLTLRSRDR